MASTSVSPPGVLRSEIGLWFGAVTTILFILFGYGWMGNLANGWMAAGLFAWLFGIILWLAFGVVRHADCLAVKLGEPYGTLILTLSVIGIEAVMIATVMMTGDDSNPSLARDTMFSVVMIVLNGMLGLTLLLGGWRHHEQEYNLSGALSYLSVLVPLSILSLVLPRFTTSQPGGFVSPFMEICLLVMSIGLYIVFLFLQTNRHQGYFKQPGETADEAHDHEGLVIRSTLFHAIFLALTMLPIVLLAKYMAKIIDYGTTTLGAPHALGGLLVAVLILSPEGMSAVKAALANKLQRTVNIALGSSVSTIGMTVPVILAISFFTGKPLELGLEPAEIAMLALTLFLTVITFTTGRTNVLQGVVHLMVFLAYLMLIFD